MMIKGKNEVDVNERERLIKMVVVMMILFDYKSSCSLRN